VPSDPRAAQKEHSGRHAADYVEDGMRVGLGTGSTVHFTTVALGERTADIVCVATSRATEKLAAECGLRVVPPGEVDGLDLAIDGADQVDAALNLVKGGGGAHTREKVVAAMADRFIVVVDDTKLVDGMTGPIPIEVVEFALDVVVRDLAGLGASDAPRRPEPSDNGNPIVDAAFGPVEDPRALALTLSTIPGIIEHGIFPAEMVERVVVAGDDVRELVRSI
jgi:ribose 5-phosphate isomerase A